MKLLFNTRLFLNIAILILPITMYSQNFIDATNDNAVLPVKLTHFEAAFNNNTVVLNWTTANESNSSHFNILRSTNGITFSSVGTVQAKGTTLNITNYAFTNSNVPLTPLYYKLEQIDADGSKYFSSTVVVKPVDVYNADVVVFPNPVVNKQLAISLKNNASGLFIISVKDILGKVLQVQNINASNNATFTIKLPQQLSTGTYMLELVDATSKNKIVKQLFVL